MNKRHRVFLTVGGWKGVPSISCLVICLYTTLQYSLSTASTAWFFHTSFLESRLKMKVSSGLVFMSAESMPNASMRRRASFRMDEVLLQYGKCFIDSLFLGPQRRQ